MPDLTQAELDRDTTVRLLRDVMTAAHFTPEGDDYTLLDCIHDAYVYARVLRALLMNHPELNAEATALIQTPAELTARGVQMGEYDRAFDTVYTREFLTLVLRITEDFYMHFGRWPSASELRGLLMKPS